MRSYEPKNTGDWKCRGCSTWGMGNQHWKDSGSNGPYCDDCIVRSYKPAAPAAEGGIHEER